MIQKEDLSDMVAEHAARQQKVCACTVHVFIECAMIPLLQKRKRATTDTAAGGKAAKKLKEFKF